MCSKFCSARLLRFFSAFSWSYFFIITVPGFRRFRIIFLLTLGHDWVWCCAGCFYRGAAFRVPMWIDGLFRAVSQSHQLLAGYAAHPCSISPPRIRVDEGRREFWKMTMPTRRSIIVADYLHLRGVSNRWYFPDLSTCEHELFTKGWRFDEDDFHWKKRLFYFHRAIYRSSEKQSLIRISKKSSLLVLGEVFMCHNYGQLNMARLCVFDRHSQRISPCDRFGWSSLPLPSFLSVVFFPPPRPFDQSTFSAAIMVRIYVWIAHERNVINCYPQTVCRPRHGVGIRAFTGTKLVRPSLATSGNRVT